jgi:hypothetical protein
MLSWLPMFSMDSRLRGNDALKSREDHDARLRTHSM